MPEAQMAQVGGNGGIEPGRFGLLLAQLRGEALHPVGEWLAVIFLCLGANTLLPVSLAHAGIGPSNLSISSEVSEVAGKS